MFFVQSGIIVKTSKEKKDLGWQVWNLFWIFPFNFSPANCDIHTHRYRWPHLYSLINKWLKNTFSGLSSKPHPAVGLWSKSIPCSALPYPLPQTSRTTVTSSSTSVEMESALTGAAPPLWLTACFSCSFSLFATVVGFQFFCSASSSHLQEVDPGQSSHKQTRAGLQNERSRDNGLGGNYQPHFLFMQQV